MSVKFDAAHMDQSEERKSSGKNAGYDYKAYLEAMHELECGSSAGSSLSMLLKLDNSALMPRQLYKALICTLKSMLLDGRHVKVVLDAWARLILNRSEPELIDDLIEAVFLLSNPADSAESLELLFDVHRVYFFKHLKELKSVAGLERICSELTAEYDTFVANLRSESTISKSTNDLE